MTPVAWSMLFVGIAIGLLGSVVMCLKVFKEEMKSIQENYEFIKKWADLTDEQYKNFDNYYNKRMDSLDKFAKDITDIAARMADNSDEQFTRIHDLMNTEVDTVSKICEALSENEEVSSERWFLLKDYILDKEDQTNEHADVAEEDGASEGGNAGDQESEQAPVVSGEEDAELVRGELGEDVRDEDAEA